MPKSPQTDTEHRNELGNLFVQAGEKQFMIRVYRKGIEDANNELNTLNQKIENAQKAYRTFLAGSQVAQQAPASVQEAPVEDKQTA